MEETEGSNKWSKFPKEARRKGRTPETGECGVHGVNLGRGMRRTFFSGERKQSRTKMGKDKGLGEEGTLGAYAEGEGTQLGHGYP